jgi:hypothetical protein
MSYFSLRGGGKRVEGILVFIGGMSRGTGSISSGNVCNDLEIWGYNLITYASNKVETKQI